MKSSKRAIFWIALAVFLIAVISSGLEVVTPKFGFTSSRVFLSLGIVAIALITFFGFLSQGVKPDGDLKESVIRTALTISVVTVYLVILGLVAFFTTANPNDKDLPQISDTMLTSFTTIVGIVVSFYFGSSAYLQAKREKSEETRISTLEKKSSEKDQ